MPILRCSREFYEFVTRQAIDTNNPASIVLDRMLVDQPVHLRQIPLIPKQVTNAKLKPKPKMKWRCTRCGAEFPFKEGPNGAYTHRREKHPNKQCIVKI